jgi:hypothetical protein
MYILSDHGAYHVASDGHFNRCAAGETISVYFDRKLLMGENVDIASWEQDEGGENNVLQTVNDGQCFQMGSDSGQVSGRGEDTVCRQESGIHGNLRGGGEDPSGAEAIGESHQGSEAGASAVLTAEADLSSSGGDVKDASLSREQELLPASVSGELHGEKHQTSVEQRHNIQQIDSPVVHGLVDSESRHVSQGERPVPNRREAPSPHVDTLVLSLAGGEQAPRELAVVESKSRKQEPLLDERNLSPTGVKGQEPQARDDAGRPDLQPGHDSHHEHGEGKTLMTASQPRKFPLACTEEAASEFRKQSSLDDATCASQNAESVPCTNRDPAASARPMNTWPETNACGSDSMAADDSDSEHDGVVKGCNRESRDAIFEAKLQLLAAEAAGILQAMKQKENQNSSFDQKHACVGEEEPVSGDEDSSKASASSKGPEAANDLQPLFRWDVSQDLLVCLGADGLVKEWGDVHKGRMRLASREEAAAWANKCENKVSMTLLDGRLSFCHYDPV